MIILLSQIWFSFSWIGRQVVSMCSNSYWDLSQHAHIKEITCEMVLSISQALLFLGDTWVLFFFFLFFSCCNMSCGQVVEQLPKGSGFRARLCFWSEFSVRMAPLCIMTGPGSKLSFCVSSAVFLGLIFIVQIASFDRASEIISESVPYSCLCIRIKPPPLPTHFCFKAVCYLPGGRLLPGRIIWMHVNKMVRSHLSWHTYWYVAVKL